MPHQAGRHRVVVFGDSATWESCEDRGPRVVELSADDYERVRQGDAKAVFEHVPGIAISDLLAGLPRTSTARPAAPLRVTSARDAVQLAEPLFSDRAFHYPSEAHAQLHQLAGSLEVWCRPGRAALRRDAAPAWWPAPKTWTPRSVSADPIVRLQLGPSSSDEPPGLSVLVEWPEGSTVRRLLGTTGHPRTARREEEAEERMMAILRAARAPSLRELVPWWVLRSVDAKASRTIVTMQALERDHDAIDAVTFEDLRADVDQHFGHGSERLPEPSVSLTWRFEPATISGLDVQQVTELVAPAVVLARIATEETLRPFGRAHPLLGAVRAGISLVDDIQDYPTGWTAPADPVDVLEHEFVAAAAPGAADHLVAHGTRWIHERLIGFAGTAEILRSRR